MMYQYLLLFISAVVPVASFVTTTPSVSCSRAIQQSALLIRQVPTTTTSSALQLKRLGYNNLSTKEFQLEELEDKDECETILWLNNDGSVTLGTTNAPQYSNYKGSWDVHGEGGKEFSVESGSVDSNDYPFRMKLIRSYDANSMDDVTYDIIREFWGNIEMVGGSVSVSGKIHDSTSNAGLQLEVGYFTLIDSAASEEEIDGAASAHPSGDGITSYLSDLGSSSSLSGSGMPRAILIRSEVRQCQEPLVTIHRLLLLPPHLLLLVQLMLIHKLHEMVIKQLSLSNRLVQLGFRKSRDHVSYRVV